VFVFAEAGRGIRALRSAAIPRPDRFARGGGRARVDRGLVVGAAANRRGRGALRADALRTVGPLADPGCVVYHVARAGFGGGEPRDRAAAGQPVMVTFGAGAGRLDSPAI
jgi:hypothetical protein